MNLLKITRISILKSIVIINSFDNKTGNERTTFLSFILEKDKISIHFNKSNLFLKNYQFNNLSIENFLFKLITNTLVDANILIAEDDIPF